MADGRAGVRLILGAERESGIGGTEEGAAIGVVGRVFDWAGVSTSIEGSLESTEKRGDCEGECRSISTFTGSRAAEGGMSAFEASASVEDWWV